MGNLKNTRPDQARVMRNESAVFSDPKKAGAQQNSVDCNGQLYKQKASHASLFLSE